MLKFTVVTSVIALLCTALGAVDARTVDARAARTDDAIKRSMLVQRDVVSPPITYPTTGTVWVVGSRHNVTWDTSVIPAGFKSNGMIVLGYLDDADGANEHLDLNNPLAKDFPITNGRAEISVPSVTTRNSYILVLFGDSGNASGKFTIKNISIGTPPSSSSTAASGPASGTASNPASGTSSADDGPDASSTGKANPVPTSSADGSAPSATGTASSTGTATGAVPSSTVPALQSSASGTPTTQGSAVAESASAPTSAPTSAAYRSAAFGGPAAWLSVACVLVGLAL